MPPVAGVTRNAEAKLNRSSRIGFGSGTIAPFGTAIVNVIPSYGLSGALVNEAFGPALDDVSQGFRAPKYPEAQNTCWMSAGACTVADAFSMGTDQSVPTAFHT